MVFFVEQTRGIITMKIESTPHSKRIMKIDFLVIDIQGMTKGKSGMRKVDEKSWLKAWYLVVGEITPPSVQNSIQLLI